MRIFRAADTHSTGKKVTSSSKLSWIYNEFPHTILGYTDLILKAPVKKKKYEKVFGEETAGTNYTDSLST